MKNKIISLCFITLIAMAGCTSTSQTGSEKNLAGKDVLKPEETVHKAQPGLDPQLMPPKAGEKIVVIETDLGTIKARVFEQDVPELSKNFLTLAEQGKYSGVPFHRVVKDFMIQTGDFTNKDGTGGYSYKGEDTYLANEINPAYHHLYGTLSMAKTSAPVSIGSQFFIVTNKEGAAFLDGNYSPFGQVFEGMDVAEKIADLQAPGTEEPSKVVNIKTVTISTYTPPETPKTPEETEELPA